MLAIILIAMSAVILRAILPVILSAAKHPRVAEDGDSERSEE